VDWQKITLIGVGLLGGSIGLATRRRKLAGEVVGCVRREASVAECEKLGVVSRATTDPGEAVRGADLVILCTPLAQMLPMVQRLLPALKKEAIVTDVGSVKGSVITELEPLIASAGGHFIGSHPMAGAEQMGVGSARADLFENAVCVLTPTPACRRAVTARVEGFWQALGGRPLRLKPKLHDELVSRSSHLPHLVAAELANYVLSPVHQKEQRLLCAGGFRDTTRVASGSPEMWRDIVMANRLNLGRVLGVFIEDLQEFQHVLERGDAKAIEEVFVKAKQRRDAWNAQKPPGSG